MNIFGFIVCVILMFCATAAWVFMAASGGFEFSPAKAKLTLPAALLLAITWWTLMSNSPFTVLAG